MKSHATNPANHGQAAPDQAIITALLKELNTAFMNVYAGMDVNNELGITHNRLEVMVLDAERLIKKAKQLQAAIKPEPHTAPGEPATPQASSFKINPPRRRSIADIMQEQAQQRGLEPMPLEPDLLLARIARAGHSGQFLADAFISAYRTSVPFPHSLGELTKLDAEGFRLFHEILHIRHVPGWNDDDLYQLERRVMALVGGVQ